MAELSEEQIALSNCPFCGGAPRMKSNGIGDFYVSCDACGAQTNDIRVEEQSKAAELWNRRPVPKGDGRPRFLVSALVSKRFDGGATYGHRATAVWAKNEDEATGWAVSQWVVDGYALESIAITQMTDADSAQSTQPTVQEPQSNKEA